MFRGKRRKTDINEIRKLEEHESNYISFQDIANNQDIIEPIYPRAKPKFMDVFDKYKRYFEEIENMGVDYINYLKIFYAFIFIEWCINIENENTRDTHYFERFIKNLAKETFKAEKYSYNISIQLPQKKADTIFDLKFKLHRVKQKEEIINTIKKAFNIKVVRSPIEKEQKKKTKKYTDMIGEVNPDDILTKVIADMVKEIAEERAYEVALDAEKKVNKETFEKIIKETEAEVIKDLEISLKKNT